MLGAAGELKATTPFASGEASRSSAVSMELERLAQEANLENPAIVSFGVDTPVQAKGMANVAADAFHVVLSPQRLGTSEEMKTVAVVAREVGGTIVETTLAETR
jgi:hypothetical protein